MGLLVSVLLISNYVEYMCINLISIAMFLFPQLANIKCQITNETAHFLNVNIDNYVSFFCVCESTLHVFSIIYLGLWLLTYRIRGVLYVFRTLNFCYLLYCDTLSTLLFLWVFIMYLLISRNKLLVLVLKKIVGHACFETYGENPSFLCSRFWWFSSNLWHSLICRYSTSIAVSFTT